MLNISGAIHHMIVIYGTLEHWCIMVISPGIFFFHFFKILIFWDVRGVKGQKTVQNHKNFSLLYLLFQEPYMIFIYDTQVSIKG